MTSLQKESEWDERIELARIRCSEVIDLDQDPPVKYGAVRCKTALEELKELDELHKQAINAAVSNREKEIKESEWEREFDEVFCKDGMLELVSIMKRNNLLKENIDITVSGKRSQFLSFIKQLLANREKEIAEDVESMFSVYPDGGIHDFGPDEELVSKKQVLSILKH